MGGIISEWVGGIIPESWAACSGIRRENSQSIVSRGRALGWTLQLPTEDKYNNSRSELLATMAVLMGGRTAEEIVYEKELS